MEKISEHLYSWASILEPSTREQAIQTSQMPFIYPHMALMPDAHLGLGATVGSVIPTLEAIMPAAVGVDIGCGMVATRTSWTTEQVRNAGDLKDLRQAIERAIPLNAGAANQRITPTAAARIDELEALASENGVEPDRYAGRWREQIGSLGSGNHFIEVVEDQEQTVWMFLHSGSRGVGNKIAQNHISVARDLMRQQGVSLPDRDLAYLTEGTPEFDEYLRDLMWAQHYAQLNRDEMMTRVEACITDFMKADVVVEQTINCHHNFTKRETHFGKEVWVSRKGAISAYPGEYGLIPGSMGDASYVVVGKGNAMSLCSAPHGAGRQLSRSAARRNFTFKDLEAAMGTIEYRKSDAFLDEIPSAYKPIDQVMSDSAELVEIRYQLKQLINVKGD
jgi:tRNA-splicing ligase RtcB